MRAIFLRKGYPLGDTRIRFAVGPVCLLKVSSLGKAWPFIWRRAYLRGGSGGRFRSAANREVWRSCAISLCHCGKRFLPEEICAAGFFT